jgi:hypothetical protein
MPADRTSLRLERDANVNEIVVSVGEESLRLCDILIGAVEIDKTDDLRRAVQLCLIYFLGKIQRVTRAALTLILSGQGDEAMLLIREQNEYVIAFNYFKKHPVEAQLFAVSQVLLKRDFAKQIMSFDEAAAQNPQRIAELAEIEKNVQIAYREFPGLRRPKGKSGSSPSPVLIDWSTPSAYAMFRDLMDGWMRDHLAQKGEAVDEKDFAERFQRTVDSTYFMRNTFINQGKHGTSFDLSSIVDIDDVGALSPVGHQADDPNRLAYHFIQHALPPVPMFRDYNMPGEFEAELQALDLSYGVLRTTLGITDEPVNF